MALNRCTDQSGGSNPLTPTPETPSIYMAHTRICFIHACRCGQDCSILISNVPVNNQSMSTVLSFVCDMQCFLLTCRWWNIQQRTSSYSGGVQPCHQQDKAVVPNADPSTQPRCGDCRQHDFCYWWIRWDFCCLHSGGDLFSLHCEVM